MKAGIQAIIQKINIDAEQHSNSRREQIMNDIDEEINGANIIHQNELAKRREMLIKHNEREYARLFERMSSRLNREILTYQHNLIDGIFDMAVSKLRNASDEELSDMFKAAVRDLKGSFILYVGELSKSRLDINNIEKIIKEKENDGLDIVLSPETIPKKSGFVLSDDRVEYNCLFEDLIEDMKNGQAASILKEVFGDCETRLV